MNFRKARAATLTSCVLPAILLVACGGSDSDVPGVQVNEVRSLSNRADLVSGNDVLIELVVPKDASLDKLNVQLDGTDVTSKFARRSDGRVLGLVDGLKTGKNTLVARSGSSQAATLVITNFAKGGPVFSGPQRQPWICMTEQNGLAPAQDAQCNAPTVVQYVYRSTDATKTAFLPYNTSSPPSDVKTTTTDEGKTVPFIVRKERGTLNRYVYDIAVLADPSKPVSPWESPAAWNKKLYYVFVGGALPQHIQGLATDSVLNERALSRGFATASSSGNIFGNSTNSVTSAETVMMVKERVTETLGEIRYTLSEGSSGGSMQQYLIANAYPGLLDGIQPSLSYQDLWTTNNEVQDCSLLLRYFDANPVLWSDSAQRLAVLDNAADLPGTCRAWTSGNVSFLGQQLDFRLDRAWLDPASGSSFVTGVTGSPSGIGLPTSKQPWMYDATTNPQGVRTTLQDYQVNIFGKRPDGAANRPYDNVGVQYGLKALKAGKITAEQFVHLNETVGGRDIDWRPTTQRSSADPTALDAAYRSGQVNLGTGLASIPVIDRRGCANFEIHSCFHSWVVRDRLKKSNGNADNHVILTTSLTDVTGSTAAASESFDLLDKWVAAIKADSAAGTTAAKVARNRPAQAGDACWISGVRSADASACQAALPRFGDPRTGAEAGPTIDVMKCQLKPLDRTGYGATFTDAQWSRLQALFAGGVCDWSKASVGQTNVVSWLNYADGAGGNAMSTAPASTLAP